MLCFGHAPLLLSPAGRHESRLHFCTSRSLNPMRPRLRTTYAAVKRAELLRNVLLKERRPANGYRAMLATREQVLTRPYPTPTSIRMLEILVARRLKSRACKS
ncbi:hypothetical protein N7G274_000378 [Stereocaulon virgatum]|uniref:Uncharacterized protein n=1 Tax=Stereocaulon virgatum TaxID=373712 RepID=A0ABR4AUQ1_9LECA